MDTTGTIGLTGKLYSDRSVTALLLSNLLTIMLAVFQQWDVHVLMWIYCGQSIVIGYFNVHRILDLKEFSTKNFRMNNRPVDPTPETQRKVAGFFALHYGFFHVAYMVFLASETETAGPFPLVSVVVCILVFYINHRFSYRYNQPREQERVPNIGSIMFFPYVRIIPMHLMIVAGGSISGGSQGALLAFLLLKTAADVAMHVIEHAMARGAVKRAQKRIS
ncbi:MAG: hypothetical protein HKP57_06685 [Halobacteria archaeon]|nr:hypothetical protein [Halobacteria archaeon]